MKKIILLLILQTLGSNLFATTWETVSNGFWDDPLIWLTGEVPPTTSNDTFFIKHPIVVSEDLIFESGAYIFIEEEGGICGHQKASLLNGSKLITYGILELDDLYVNSGYIGCFAGTVLLTTSATITGVGGEMSIDLLGSLVVGTWFECILPAYSFLANQSVNTEETLLAPAIEIYPNPFTNSIAIKGVVSELISEDKTSKIVIYDLIGREVFRTDLTDEGLNQLDLNFLNDGVYVLTISNKEEVYSTKIVKE